MVVEVQQCEGERRLGVESLLVCSKLRDNTAPDLHGHVHSTHTHRDTLPHLTLVQAFPTTVCIVHCGATASQHVAISSPTTTTTL